MTARFIETAIGDQITLQRGFDITRNEQADGKIPVVSSGGISSYHNEAMAEGPGVVIGRKGSLGTTHYIKGPYWPHDTTLWVKDFKGNNPRYVYYFLLNIAERLKLMDVGAANPSLNRNHVHPMRVTWAIGDTQNDIAGVLGSLDDGVEEIRKSYQTLETIAQTIFTSWFVDFEPVKAKVAVLAAGGSVEEAECAAMRALAPALDPAHATSSTASKPINLRALAASFPSELVDAEFGPLPNGWKQSTYSEMLEVRKGLSYKGEFLAGPTDGPPMINLGCFGGSGTYCPEKLKYYSGPYKPRHVVKSGALLVANTDMTQNRIILGSPIVAPDVEGDLLFTHHTFAVDFKADYPEDKWKPFAFYSFLQPSFRERAEGFATGTTVLAMPQDALGKCEVVIPNEPCVKTFNAIIYPIWDLQSRLRNQIRSLTELRDLLLPKLLCGEMEPRNA